MRETKFIEQNKEKWSQFEKTLEQESQNPEKLNDLFVQVTDDLSYARTFYPNRSVRVYLNGLAQKIFISIYKGKKRKKGRLVHFVTEDLPQLVYEARQEFRLSFIVFAAAVAIGVLSSAMNEDFVRIILGDGYVEMTLENINSGDPMAVYKAKNEGSMFARITANNLRVALMTFAMGALYAVGTIFILIKNGIMVGAFQYFFIAEGETENLFSNFFSLLFSGQIGEAFTYFQQEQGLFLESFLTIWTHGTLEISAIIIAGAAGLTMGKGLVFPGTLSRIKAFQISARRGLKIMVGITPIIILAGFIEGFFTRYTDAPDILRLAFIVSCAAFIYFYFVHYPRAKAKRGFQSDLSHSQLSPENNQKIDYQKIKTNGEIFSDVFVFLGKYMTYFARLAFFSTSIFIVFAFVLSNASPANTFSFSSFVSSMEPGAYQIVTFIIQLLVGSLSVAGQFFINEEIPLLIAVNALVFSFMATAIFSLLLRETKPEGITKQEKKKLGWYFLLFSKMLLPATLLAYIFSTNAGFTYLLGVIGLPLTMLWMYIMVFEGKHVFLSFARVFELIQGSFWRIIGLSITLSLLGMLTFMLIDSVVFYFVFEFIGMNLSFQQDTMDNIASVVLTGLAMFFLHLILSTLMVGYGIVYHTLLEIKEAPSLSKQVETVGEERRLQGMLRENA